MADVLPWVFASAGALCLGLVLFMTWQSVRALLAAARDTTQVPASAGEGARRELVREKDALLSAIRELRFERDLGKVSEADMAQLEQRYRGRAREVLRLLDEEIEPHREAARALIEAARGAGAKREVAAKTDEPGVRSCGACQTRNDADAAFCKKCGGKLGTEVAT